MKHLFAVAICGACFVGVAHAGDNLTISKFADGHYDDVKIKFNGKVQTVNAGPFSAKLNGGTAFEAYCVDLAHDTTFNSAYEVTLSSAASSLNNGAKVGQLYNAFANKVNSDSWAAALQLAIWDTVYAGTGKFQFVDASSDVEKNFKYIKSANLSKYSADLIYYGATSHGANGRSNQNVVGPGAVPEPGTMIALAAGLAAAATRRRRKAQQA